MHVAVDAVLFDNDGVLVDSHEQVERAWRQLAAEFGLDYSVLAGELVGVRATDTLGRHLRGADIERAVARLEDLEVAIASTTRPLPGAVDLLATLDGARWAIVTSASRRLAEARWAGAGIPVAPLTVTAEDVSAGKPDPEPYLVAADRLGVDPARCLVVEDSPSGGLAGVAIGATVVAVGEQRWSVAPSARVVDLSTVTAVVAAGTIEVTLGSAR